MLAAALLLVWLATQLLPTPAPETTHSFSDDAGTVVIGSELAPLSAAGARRVATPGRIAAVVLLVIGGCAALFLRRRNRPGVEERATLRAVGKLQLAPGQQLHLVACGDDLLLLGATGSQITLLKSLSSQDDASTSRVRSYRRDEIVRPLAAERPLGRGQLSSKTGSQKKVEKEGQSFAEILRRMAPTQVGSRNPSHSLV